MKHKNYFLIFSFAILLVVAGNSTTFGQTCINLAAPSTISENFDTLANSGSSSTYPPGFAAIETNTVITSYTANAGSNIGGIHSYGTGTDADRALGGQSNGTTGTLIYGGCITNTSGTSFGSIVIDYVGEQWRQGSNPTGGNPTDALTFEYSTNATGINDGTATWTAVSALDFTAVQINGAGAGNALDGNLGANQVTPTAIITALVNPTGSFYFRWLDPDASGTDHGLSIDNFTLSARIPTAGDGTIVGRARTENGRGLKYVVVMLTGGELQEPLYATTNQLGYYRFEDIQVGQSYVLQAISGRYSFLNSTRLINLDDSLTNEDFIAESPGVGDDKTILIPKNQSKSRRP